MCKCAAEKINRGDSFSIDENSDDLIELQVLKENVGSIRTYRLSSGNTYKVGRRYTYVYAYEGDVEELLNIKLRNKRILINV